MEQEEGERRELFRKVLFLGGIGSGKTAIIKRSTKNEFTHHYHSTIVADFAVKVIDRNHNLQLRLSLLDLSGTECYNKQVHWHYQDAVAAFIVFDVTRVSITLYNAIRWKEDLNSKSPVRVPIILLANKTDLCSEWMNKDNEPYSSREKMDEFCKENGFLTWMETSAKENVGIEEAFESMIDVILSRES